VAWAFSFLSALPFGPALALWTGLGLACLALSAILLCTLIREASGRPAHWLLVPAMLLVAPPTIQALGHGQNTPFSLLLLTITVLAWRAREPLWAGLACSLLFYKPQLATIVFFALTLTLGWRVWIGMLVGGVPQLLLTVSKLPGTLAEFFSQVPHNLGQIQFAQPYLWHRHATLNGFFRFLLQGNGAGETASWIGALSVACMLLVGAAVVFVWWRRRDDLQDPRSLDRFIALVILSMPLLMPFFFDYDLLLLIVAGVLVARERLETSDHTPAMRRLVIVGVSLYAWTLVNPALAEVTGISLTVPLLCAAVALQARRCCVEPEPSSPLRLPASRGERLAA
jgi:hypothetical protein